MRTAIFLLTLLSIFVKPGFSQSENTLLTAVLSDHVREGRVDYPRLCADARWRECLAWLSSTDPDSLPSDQAKLAFWINAYNAWTLKIICDNYPLKSINELHSGGLAIGMVLKTTVWDKKIVTINNEKTSLSDIEHKIIRPVFRDPRIHFAIVCAAKGCPPLRSEAYEGERLDQQLDDQGWRFLAQEEKNAFDFQNQVAHISPIFGWFKEDFGKKPENILRFMARYLPQDQRDILLRDAVQWKIRYTRYDWSLNE